MNSIHRVVVEIMNYFFYKMYYSFVQCTTADSDSDSEYMLYSLDGVNSRYLPSWLWTFLSYEYSFFSGIWLSIKHWIQSQHLLFCTPTLPDETKTDFLAKSGFKDSCEKKHLHLPREMKRIADRLFSQCASRLL